MHNIVLQHDIHRKRVKGVMEIKNTEIDFEKCSAVTGPDILKIKIH